MTRRTAALVLLPVAMLVGCSDGSDETEDAARYCDLVAELESAGEEIFGGLGENPTEEQLVSAEAELVDRMADELDEMIDVAPEEIASDVEAYVQAYRDRAGGEEGADVSAEEQRILDYEERNC